MEEGIVNKVAGSGLVSFDLENYLPGEPVKGFDLKGYLFMELILKEKDFREALKNTDWHQYKDCHVAVYCSADAIIPAWAFMLVASALAPHAASVYTGTEEELKKHLLLKNIDAVNAADYRDQRVVIKGCGDENIQAFAYAAITSKLQPVVKSLMYGEPCSTVPVFKRK